MQRPEFVCGSSQPLVISEVLQTSNSVAGSAQGNMAGHGISAGRSGNDTYVCHEHGVFMTLAYVLPNGEYQDGLSREFQKFDKFDYYWQDYLIFF